MVCLGEGKVAFLREMEMGFMLVRNRPWDFAGGKPQLCMEVPKLLTGLNDEDGFE